MISMLEGLPQEQKLWQALEENCPAEAAMIWAEAPLLGYQAAGLWRQEQNETTTALLLRNTMGGVILAALPEADPEELAEFLQVVGFSSLTLPNGWVEKLSLPDTRAGKNLVMEWTEEQAPLPYGYRLEEIGAGQLLENTLAAFAAQIPQEEQQEWQWAFGLRIRRGTARAMGLFQRDRLLAAAALSHIGRSTALIGFVGTPPNMRGNGHGRRLAAVLAALAKEQGLRPLLCCRKELEELYRTVGFAAVGTQWTVYPL